MPANASATVNSGLIGTIHFGTTEMFWDTEIGLVRAELDRGGQVESAVLNVRVALLVALPPSPDFDGSGFVDLDDFFMLIKVFGYREGQEKYEVKYDLNGDGEIGSGRLCDFSPELWQVDKSRTGLHVTVSCAALCG